MNEQSLVGTVVILAVIAASMIGIWILSDGPGKAYTIPGDECDCRTDGYSFTVLYSDGYVVYPDGRSRSVSIDEDMPVCPQVCGAIGTFS